jgi:hypothetical protein
MAKTKKKRASKYEDKLSIHGTFEDVVKVSVQPPYMESKKEKTSKHYFVVTVQAVINGKQMDIGKLGVDSPTSDYKPNVVKNTATEYFIKKYPSSKVAILILEHQEVTKDQYLEQAKSFLEI